MDRDFLLRVTFETYRLKFPGRRHAHERQGGTKRAGAARLPGSQQDPRNHTEWKDAHGLSEPADQVREFFWGVRVY